MHQQLEALQAGDVLATFAFASPANAAITGPVDKFAALLENPTYRPLSQHMGSEVGCCKDLPAHVTRRTTY